MKKLYLLFLILILSTVSSAQYTYQIIARNLVAPDNSTSANIIGSGAAFHNLTWNVSGTVSGCSVRVDGSADGITWGTGDVIGATTCTSNGNTLSTSHVVNYVRINLVTFTGTLPVFTANVSGYITQPTAGGTVTSVICGTGLSGGTITTTGTCSLTSPVAVANGGTGSTTGFTSAGVVGLFTSCSGTQYLGADGACHTVSGGALVQLCSLTASASTELDFQTSNCPNGVFSSTYHRYIITVDSLVYSTSLIAQLQMGTGGGPTYDTGSNYSYIVVYGQNVSSAGGLGSASDTSIVLRPIITQTTSTSTSANLMLHDPLNASLFKQVGGDVETDDTTGHLTIESLMGEYKSTTALTAFRLKASTGNFTSGTVTLYGVTP